MALYETIRYYPRSAPLKHLIKYFWVFESQSPVILNHTLLPVSNIDLIFNLCSPTVYEKRKKVFETPGNTFFSGLRSEPIIMKQSGLIFTLGVAFFPAGFFPFFGIPVSEFKNITVGLQDILPKKTERITQALMKEETTLAKIRVLEQFFMELLNEKNLLPQKSGRLLNQFYRENTGVNAFCDGYGIHPRKLERIFNRYVGTSPKGFLRLNRFQSALNSLLKDEHLPLTRLAYDFDYYDQPHFIRDFKAFTGASPSRFLKEKKAILQLSRPHLKESSYF
ncbi:MAG: helix-turn-helix domain-containing protein [Desulfobacterales bacterium]|nr:helix-turn-helix domain-containing protein [Desulfobacterales bacterium]